MNATETLLSGYLAYTDAADLGASATGEAPATTPSIVTASSPECVAFTIGLSQGAVVSGLGLTGLFSC